MEQHWSIAAQLRDMSRLHLPQLPTYLLAYEVSALLAFIPDFYKQTLIELLFHTGARINEALALTPADFAMESARPFVALKTLKQRSRGRPPKDQPAKRLVPILDVDFADKLKRFLATFGQSKNKLIWDVTAQTVRNWLTDAVAQAAVAGVRFSIGITPHVFRHSFAMHLLLFGHIHIKRLQAYLGHRSIRSTEIYTQLLSLDAGATEPALSFTVAALQNPLLQPPSSMAHNTSTLFPSALSLAGQRN